MKIYTGANNSVSDIIKLVYCVIDANIDANVISPLLVISFVSLPSVSSYLYA